MVIPGKLPRPDQVRQPDAVDGPERHRCAKLLAVKVSIEACGGAHHWAREIAALGHDVKLLPPNYVKAYLKRGKTDAADAEAICEAVTRPGMRFVPVKTVAQQSVLMLHRTRDLLVRQRTMLVNAIRGH